MNSINVNQLQQAMMFGLQPLKENALLAYTSNEGDFAITLRQREEGNFLLIKDHESDYTQELKLHPTTGGGWAVRPFGGELECIQDDSNGTAMYWHEGHGPRQMFDADSAMRVQWNGKHYSPSQPIPGGAVEFGDFKISKIIDPKLGETVHVEHVDGWTLTVIKKQEQQALAACAAMGIKITN